MNIIKSQTLGNVVLPLINVMAEADLSWAEREKVSAAIAAAHRQWAQMEKERSNAQALNNSLNQAMGQQNVPQSTYGQPGNPR